MPYETWILTGGVGRDEGIQGTVRVVAPLHETAHFLQDLPLGVSIERDCQLDESLGHLALLLIQWCDRPVPRLPLTGLRPYLDAAGARLVDGILEREALAERLLAEAFLVRFDEPGREPCELSGPVLLEGLRRRPRPVRCVIGAAPRLIVTT